MSAGAVTRTMPRDSVDAQALLSLHRELMQALNMMRGVTHTEFIKGREDGRFYFLETAARVGGAYIAEMVEAATGLNLWAEWAKIDGIPGLSPAERQKRKEAAKQAILNGQ